MEQDKNIPTGSEENVDEVEDHTGSDEESNEKKTARRSFTWKHFNSVQDGDIEFAVCKYCSKRYVFASKAKPKGSTGNQIRHLAKTHPDIETEEEIRKFVFSQAKFRTALLKWIIECKHEITEPQNEAFLQVVRSLNPKAEVVLSTTLKKDITKCYADKFEAVKKKLSDCSGKFSFTVTLVLKKTLSFVKIKVYWINSIDWKKENMLLDVTNVNGADLASEICDIFVRCLGQYEIPLSKVLGVTLNTSPDVGNQFMNCLRNHGTKTAVNISSVENKVNCLINILNSAVQEILSSLKCRLGENGDLILETEVQESFKSAITKLRQFIEKATTSREVLVELKEMCRLMSVEFKLLIVDAMEKPNSTYTMIEKAIHLKAPLRALCLKDKSLIEYHLSEREWDELNSVKDLLQKFDRATNFMSKNECAISAYLPTLNWVIDSLESFHKENVGPLADAVEMSLAKIKSFELSTTSSKIPFVAVFLNPSLKLNYFKEHSYTKSFLKDIEKCIHETFKKIYLGKTADCDEYEEEEEDEFFSHMFKRAKKNDISKEFQNYCRYPLSAPKVNVFDFWKAQGKEFPNLIKMAGDYLGVPSFTEVENDFLDNENLTDVDVDYLDVNSASICLRSWFKEKL